VSQPWLKKNPFMSLWLSGAHAVTGSMRCRAAAQARRQTAAAMTKATKDVVDAWVAAGLMPLAPKTRKRKRR
jgi:hypothetical protein